MLQRTPSRVCRLLWSAHDLETLSFERERPWDVIAKTKWPWKRSYTLYFNCPIVETQRKCPLFYRSQNISRLCIGAICERPIRMDSLLLQYRTSRLKYYYYYLVSYFYDSYWTQHFGWNCRRSTSTVAVMFWALFQHEPAFDSFPQKGSKRMKSQGHIGTIQWDCVNKLVVLYCGSDKTVTAEQITNRMDQLEETTLQFLKSLFFSLL